MRLLDLLNQVDDQVVAAGRSLFSKETRADGQHAKTARSLQSETRREPSASGPAGRPETEAEPAPIDDLLPRIEELAKRLLELERRLATRE